MAIRDFTKGNLVGVDLSPHMVEKARARNLYDHLDVADIGTYTPEKDKYSLVFTCDVFPYFGDLSGIFQSSFDALKPDGVFAFSNEMLEASESKGLPYKLRRESRFAHTKAYGNELAEKTGFELVAHETGTIRRNAGKDVIGSLCIFEKPAIRATF